MIQLLEASRRKMFWLKDSLSGSTVKKHFNEIKQIIDNPNSPRSKSIRETHLSNLIEHATKTVEFYKGAPYNSGNIYDFPIINKNTVLDNYEDFKSSVYKNQKLYASSSSGSTGIPFTILQDRGKRLRNTADAIYYAKIGGHDLGNKLIFIRLWDGEEKGKLELFLQNILAHNVMDASDDDIRKLLAKIENDKSNKSILGYPSFFEQVCKYLDKKNYTPKIQNTHSIISMSESLNDFERDGMTKYFNAPVYERYSNQENGILAQQTEFSNGKYIFNCASYRIEILKLNSNEHVKPGEIGRIIVTDFFNYSMPLIRYDTGDMALYEEPEVGYPVFTKILGRRHHMIQSTEGELISPYIFYHVLDYSKAKQFQFIQKEQKKYVFKLNARKENTDETTIIDFFKGVLGEDASILFEYVEEIPLLSSGKRMKVRNDYLNPPE